MGGREPQGETRVNIPFGRVLGHLMNTFGKATERRSNCGAKAGWKIAHKKPWNYWQQSSECCRSIQTLSDNNKKQQQTMLDWCGVGLVGVGVTPSINYPQLPVHRTFVQLLEFSDVKIRKRNIPLIVFSWADLTLKCEVDFPKHQAQWARCPLFVCSFH